MNDLIAVGLIDGQPIIVREVFRPFVIGMHVSSEERILLLRGDRACKGSNVLARIPRVPVARHDPKHIVGVGEQRPTKCPYASQASTPLAITSSYHPCGSPSGST